MILPAGTIWQSLRADALATVTPAARALYSQTRGLSDWYRAGAYRVTSAQPRGFDLEAVADDLGSALLGDVEHFSDHAAEHRVILFKTAKGTGWDSAAWSVVTAYYWAFFSGMALSRLMGETVAFLDGAAVAGLSRLAPAGGARVGPGTFRLICGPSIGVVDRSLEIRKSRSTGVHEALWSTLLGRLTAAFRDYGNQQANQLEFRLYSGIARLSERLGHDWPSALRNVVNYRAGFAYGAVRNRDRFDLPAWLRRTRGWDAERLVADLESALNGVGRREATWSPEPPLGRAVLLLGVFLSSLLADLYEDLRSRGVLDARCRNARDRFIRRHGLALPEPWPA